MAHPAALRRATVTLALLLTLAVPAMSGAAVCMTTCTVTGTLRWNVQEQAVLAGAYAAQVAASGDPTQACESYVAHDGPQAGLVDRFFLKSYSCDGQLLSSTVFTHTGWLFVHDIAVVPNGLTDEIFVFVRQHEFTTFLNAWADVYLYKFQATAGVLAPAPVCSTSYGSPGTHDVPWGLVASAGGVIGTGYANGDQFLAKWGLNCGLHWLSTWASPWTVSDVDVIAAAGTSTLYVGGTVPFSTSGVRKYTCATPSCTTAPTLDWSTTVPLDLMGNVAATSDGVFLAGADDDDVAVQKLDTTGATVWTADADFFDGQALSVVRSATGDALVTGMHDRNGPDGDQGFLAHYDSASGAIDWQDSWGGAYWTYGGDVATTLDGNAIVGGGDFNAVLGAWDLMHRRFCD